MDELPSDLTRKCMQILVSVLYCNSASVVNIICINFMKKLLSWFSCGLLSSVRRFLSVHIPNNIETYYEKEKKYFADVMPLDQRFYENRKHAPPIVCAW